MKTLIEEVNALKERLKNEINAKSKYRYRTDDARAKSNDKIIKMLACYMLRKEGYRVDAIAHVCNKSYSFVTAAITYVSDISLMISTLYDNGYSVEQFVQQTKEM